MNTQYKWLLILLVFGFIACESDDENPDAGTEQEVEITSGEADFSKFVAVGNSLIAGFTDGALFIAGQENSMPNILAGQFALAGGGEFTQPLMNDNVGGLLLGGTQVPGFGPRFFFNGAGPAPLDALPTTEIGVPLTGSFSNMGVTGAKSFHLLAPGYGDVTGLGVTPATANPYFVRMASSPNATVLEDAMAQNPTFFSLWIGNNDVLGYALSGGDGSSPITDTAVFEQVYTTLVTTLTSGSAKGVVFNIPNVTSIPYFTTVPNNALVLSVEQAASLTGFFQAVTGLFTASLIAGGTDPADAQALAAQYAITFEEGANRWIIDVPVSSTNPLGFRQMTEDELLVLTIDQTALAEQGYGSVALTPDVLQVLGILQAGGMPTPEQAGLVLGAVNGIDDKDALDSDEISEIADAMTQYNTTIKAAVDRAGLAFVDANAFFNQLANGGVVFDDFLLESDLVVGGAISLDGIHPTARGNAIITNLAMDAINTTYGSNLPAVKAADYPTFYSGALQ